MIVKSALIVYCWMAIVHYMCFVHQVPEVKRCQNILGVKTLQAQNFGTALIASSQRQLTFCIKTDFCAWASAFAIQKPAKLDRGEPQKSCEDAAKLYKLDLSVDAPLCQLLQVLPKDAQNEPEFKEGPIPQDRQIRQVPSSELKQSNTNSSIDFINNNFMVKQVQNQVIVLKNTVSEEQLKALAQVKGQKVYLDIGISFDPKRYYQTKESHYASMLDQDGNPIKVIPIIIGKNCTIHTKSKKFFEQLDLNIENVYEEIGNLLAVYYVPKKYTKESKQ
ncbi:Hypothetical_protein [Hexamita inflata]|uniref:Hypothetical_protein n=1 Tax=Hexamita inflata TaxID=28002 RepID=A0ABP1HMW3_9EUKA